MAALSLSLLGPFATWLDGRDLTKFRRNKVQALLIYLSVESERAHRRDFLMELLWPELPQASAQVNLRQTIYLLNQAIPEVASRADSTTVPLLLSDRQTVQINPDGAYESDVTTFTSLLKGEPTLEKLKQAVALYRGDFLVDFYLPDSNTFEEWTAAWRASLRRQVLKALDSLTTTRSKQGDYAAAIITARRQLEIDNLRESAHRQLMVALAHSGQRSEALAQYETCRRLLQAELGVEPSPPTRALYERLARNEPLLGMPVTATPPERYRLDKEIGRGAVGIVYHAHDTLLDRPVAVKVLSPGALGTEGRARLLREAQAVAKLSHPNIVPVYDAGERDSSPFIVMELIEGKSLRDAFPPASPLSPLPSVLLTARQVCAALAHAHAHGIIHRDLKPENVLLTPDGTAKLMDFGLAHSAVTPRLTAEGAIVGTPAYLAPEIALGQAIDGRADLYALGVMLYELTTGRLPFSGHDILAIISQHLHAPMTPPGVYNAAIPPALDALIGQLMSKQPADRPASATAVLQALDELGRTIERQPDATLLPHHLTPPPPTGALHERLAGGEAAAVAAGPGVIGQPGAGERSRHNLLLQLSSFVGREQELAEVGRLLAASRLVTLTGPGGCGKTRLALQAAGGVLDTFAGGVCFVELASLSEAALVPQAVATALEVREAGDRPLLSLLLNYLRTRHLLLLLDNCEHLVEAAAQLAEALLSHCPQLQILATSREALNITGEVAWLVPSLSLPEPGEQPPLDTLKQADAIRLFVERATAVLPGFSLTGQNATVVEQVCRRLDGIPLAIELAAARVKMLRVEQIAARLDDRFQLLAGGSRTALPRHQTLQALIDWSYNLLTPAEQRLLRRLSVFAGGFTMEAAEAICSLASSSGRSPNGPVSGTVGRPATSAADVLELLAQLVNKSLVVMKREPGQEARYHLLETIRQYALEKLKEEGEAGPVQARHLDFFLQLAETAEPWLDRAEQIIWLDRLEAEHDNLRAALAWSLKNQNGDLESGLRLATALVEFWTMRAHLREGVRWLDVALASRYEAAPPVQARLLLNAGSLRLYQGKSDPTALLEESLALYRQLNDKKGIAWSLGWLGFCVLRYKRDVVAATSLFAESLSLARDVDDKPLLIWLYSQLGGWLAAEKGDFDQATELATKGLALVRETGERQKKGLLLMTLGSSAALQRDYARATAFFQEALALARELKDRGSEAAILNNLGAVMHLQRAYEEAAVFYHESLALHREVDNWGGVALVLNNLGLVALGQGDRPQARSLFRESMALAQEMKDKLRSCLNVLGLARVALAEGQTRRAVQLFAATERLLETFGYSLPPVEQDEYERDVALARTQLGEEAFAAALAEGQAMSLEEAIAYALEA